MDDLMNEAPPAERQEDINALEKKADTLAQMIQESSHFIVFTGAGISTSAGIPDFRGPQGVWTLRAQGKDPSLGAISTLQAIPTPTHMALVEMQDRGVLKYLVSQNCDGLHRRSGIWPNMISELHGNSNREICKDGCGKEYIRDFRAVSTYENGIHDHRTGRRCAVCGTALHDSIINFGEQLPSTPLHLAFEAAKKADLCLVLGSSLSVEPANQIPQIVGEKAQHVRHTRNGGSNARSREAEGGTPKLVICNLQPTPQDDLSALRIWAKTDDLITRVMARLGFAIPPFILKRRLSISVGQAGSGFRSGRDQIYVAGVDVDGTPMLFLRSVKLLNFRRKLTQEPFVFEARSGIGDGDELKFELEFMGNYGEPNLEIVHTHEMGEEGKKMYGLEYNPANGEWKATVIE